MKAPPFLSSLRLLLAVFLLPAPVTADYPCSGNYTWWPRNGDDGFCITFSDDFTLDSPQANDYCKKLGSFAPSIHSKKDLEFWEDLVVNIGIGHFWMGTNCPHEQDPYTWTDGTKTNYFGENKELLSCVANQGFHMHNDGLIPYNLIDDEDKITIGFSAAPALCAYEFTFVPTPEPTTPAAPTTAELDFEATSGFPEEDPTTTTPKTTTTTTKKPTTTTKVTTPFVAPLPDLNDAYCSCEPESLYLDLVFIVDNSADMTTQMLGAANALVQSVLAGFCNYTQNPVQCAFGTDMFQSQIAVVSFADSVTVVRDFGTFKTADDIWSLYIPQRMAKANQMTNAIKTATGIISSKARDFTRGVIVMISNSYDQMDQANIIEASATFQDNGGIFVSIDYSASGELAGLRRIASKGYYINDNTHKDDLAPDVLYAFCDANCFCSDGETPYDTANERGTPQGCYHVAESAAVFVAADDNCKRESGFVATAHDTDKNYFLMSLFKKNSNFWLGYQRTNGAFTWEDNSKNPFTAWAAGNPVSNQDCAYGKQTTGFNSAWYSAGCRDSITASHQYACQLRPCDSTYNCWV